MEQEERARQENLQRIQEKAAQAQASNQTPIPLLINSQYYRVIDRVENRGTNQQKFVLRQSDLGHKFTLISYSKYIIESLCTEGIDQEELEVFNKARSDTGVCKINPLMNKKDTKIHPKEYGVTYNDDTGLCNFTIDWCREMGMGEIITKSYPGLGPTTYKTCETSAFDEGLSFISETGAEEFERHINNNL